jgi:tRNA pseudouridine13 synthase
MSNIKLEFLKAYGEPVAKADFKQEPEDFMVNEVLGFEPSDDGQHLFLQIEKTNLNTGDVQRHLTDKTGIKPLDIGHSGLKDKNAITCQWFSLDLKGQDAPLNTDLETSQIKVLQSLRHTKKLKIGSHVKNEFIINLKNIEGDRLKIEERLSLIAKFGTPNYFGEQRFGYDGSNLTKADAWMSGKFKIKSRKQRGFLYSVIRSFLFNQILSKRIEQGNWNKIIAGDVLKFDDSNSCFYADDIESVADRFEKLEIHPTVPLWGVDGFRSQSLAKDTEDMALTDFAQMRDFLEQEGLSLARRATRQKVDNLKWDWQGDSLILKFSLVKGAFATSVLNEICE